MAAMAVLFPDCQSVDVHAADSTVSRMGTILSSYEQASQWQEADLNGHGWVDGFHGAPTTTFWRFSPMTMAYHGAPLSRTKLTELVCLQQTRTGLLSL